ncbi:response regulator [Vibrio hepatarius]|uniref:response regulator n=1 Tax=Vibrio hepatarius TaxID=171383 RepID=UPI003736C4CC
MNTKLDLKSLKVLVADDSRLVCNSIAVILREIGFISGNIICAYKPIDAINHCKNYCFDVVICDYNFNSKLNGYQLLDELRHMQLLASHVFFVFLTGENQPKIVRSIIDGEPDDYLLKPFNKPFFSSRLYSGLQRKQSLSSIYSALHKQSYQLAIDEAELLQPFFPKYALTIGTLKARALMALKNFDEAVQEYESLLQVYDNDLLKARMAHSLVAKGDRDRACEVLATLENQENNPYYHDIRASMSIQSGDLPDAILHLKKATLLMEVGAERELIISNLSLALEQYEDAFNYIKQYAEKTRVPTVIANIFR